MVRCRWKAPGESFTTPHVLGQWLCKQIGEAFGCDKIIEPIAKAMLRNI